MSLGTDPKLASKQAHEAAMEAGRYAADQKNSEPSAAFQNAYEQMYAHVIRFYRAEHKEG